VIEVWREAARYSGGGDGVQTRHAFSFGGHYDPANVGFGLLLACNEETLQPGAGFADHPHRDTEIVTWVIDGELEHRGPGRRSALLRAGDIQRLSAAGGVRHAERNPGPRPLRFLQMWLHPDTFGGTPDYTAVTAPAPPGPGLTLLASGVSDDSPPVRLRQHAAALHAGRPEGPAVWQLPDAPYLYVHVVRGTVRVDAGPGAGAEALGPGDAARITDARGVRAATRGSAEFLVWEMHAVPSYG
jgi:redox-sensitive bicupin YhaK (pirin superfamily)